MGPRSPSGATPSVDVDEHPKRVVGRDGATHRYLNSAYPINPATGRFRGLKGAAVCRRCHHGYAALALRPDLEGECLECRGQRLVAWGLRVQGWLGVDLGWRGDQRWTRDERYRTVAGLIGMHRVRRRAKSA